MLVCRFIEVRKRAKPKFGAEIKTVSTRRPGLSVFIPNTRPLTTGESRTKEILLMKISGNLILMTATCVIVSLLVIAIRPAPAHAKSRLYAAPDVYYAASLKPFEAPQQPWGCFRGLYEEYLDDYFPIIDKNYVLYLCHQETPLDRKLIRTLKPVLTLKPFLK
jgi:hypothetical protein